MERRIVCYGDSNTFGYDPCSPLGGRYPRDVRWTGLLEADGWTVSNEGENGRSIPRLDWEFKAVVQAARRAEVLTVMLGTNDLLQRPGLRAEVCAGRMEAFLTAVLPGLPPECEVLLIAPPPMKPGLWVRDDSLLEESARLAGAYEALARRLGVGFANAGEWNAGLAYDGVHFSPEGHRAFARKLLETLNSRSGTEKEE